VLPLTEEVKRFWRSNIAVGAMAVQDMRRFYAKSAEESALLQQDMRRFLTYGSTEWRRLVVQVRRFAIDFDPAFGDSATPMQAGDGPVQVFDDYMLPRAEHSTR